MRIAAAGSAYFALVFVAGFLLGTIRTIFVVPRVGSRRAELMEAPVMLAITILAAWFAVRHFGLSMAASIRLEAGAIGLVLMLIAEFGLVRWLRGISIREYLATRDPVAGSVYYAMLIVYALMPLLVARS